MKRKKVCRALDGTTLFLEGDKVVARNARGNELDGQRFFEFLKRRPKALPTALQEWRRRPQY